ncbi:glycosyltransferase [Thermococcus sp. 101 C5]|uniref:glycosyltransferase family 4 protein n=1 Tax=Thermococcus sp. 101 C5 TaxID=2654197 RepID=UPI00128CE3AE|nr:glycosyltransferase family 4 protein [Thermococcus sp. 101 C5]MPW38613.1 glycosyltransferase [Thermococcus sp. 101 C5]
MEEVFSKSNYNTTNNNIKPRVAVVSFPWASYVPYKFLSDVLKILEPICEKIVLIDGNTERVNIASKKVKVRDIGVGMHYLKDIKPKFYSAILWTVKCILSQVKISLELIRVRKDIDVVIFYMAYPYYLLPLITSKILRKKTVEVVTRSKSKSFLSKIISLQDPLLFSLLDGISPESKSLIKELGLEKYKGKLLPEGARFVDVTRYTIKKKLSERENIVGFIGRLRKEKGVMEFVRAIPIVASENKNVKFLIGGDGDLLNWVKNECKKIRNEYKINITIVGWIGKELPEYLNELKLLVLPTYEDAFPTIILEAMACGTPVLATPVGAIPDIIKDGETGFIMKDNSPECIAENVIRALNHSDIESIAENGRKLVEQKFTYEGAIERWSNIIKLV